MGNLDDGSAEASLSDLKRRSKITSDIRFQAALRLVTRQKGATYGISCLSLFVIALSLLPNILSLRGYQSQILLACSIILSVFIIFSSIIDGAQNYINQAELLRECARVVEKVYLDAKQLDPTSETSLRSRIDELRQRYFNALDACPINHAHVDYLLLKAKEPQLFQNAGERHESGSRFGRASNRFKKFRNLAWAQTLTHMWAAPYVIALSGVAGTVCLLVIKGSPWGGT